MTLREFISKIDEKIPFASCESWDNSGLLIGAPQREVGRVMVALDATHDVLDEAIKKDFRTVVTHHPIIFPMLTLIDTSQFVGSIIEKAIKNDIAIIALHTNWDKTGLNTSLAELLGLADVEPLKNNFGVIGNLKENWREDEFVEFLKKSWGLSRIVCHSKISRCCRVALCGGAGGDFWFDAHSAGADIFISAEIKLHQRISAEHAGLCIIEVDHAEVEAASLPALVKIIVSDIRYPISDIIISGGC